MCMWLKYNPKVISEFVMKVKLGHLSWVTTFKVNMYITGTLRANILLQYKLIILNF